MIVVLYCTARFSLAKSHKVTKPYINHKTTERQYTPKLALHIIHYYDTAITVAATMMLIGATIVLPQAYVPGDTNARTNGAELMYDVSREEIGIVVHQGETRVPYANSPFQFVQLCFLHPLGALHW